jgi:hypothetical protein
MKRLFYVVILFFLAIVSGCSDDELTEQTSSIYLQKFSLEDLYFKDTTLTYDFNGNNRDDFEMELSWDFDTTGITYSLEGNDKLFFKNYAEIKCGMSDFIDWESQRRWQPGDTVSDADSFESWSVRSGGFGINTNNTDTFRTKISGFKLCYYRANTRDYININC